MTTQTEAQRIAIDLDLINQRMEHEALAYAAAAAELRRLESANAELLEALISIAEDSSDEGARECAMDAIKKHGGAA